jgi:hypothetical protein
LSQQVIAFWINLVDVLPAWVTDFDLGTGGLKHGFPLLIEAKAYRFLAFFWDNGWFTNILKSAKNSCNRLAESNQSRSKILVVFLLW